MNQEYHPSTSKWVKSFFRWDFIELAWKERCSPGEKWGLFKNGFLVKDDIDFKDASDIMGKLID